MRIDLYTKVVLTAIAGFLGVIALRPLVGPEVVQAQGAFSGVQFSGTEFFDSRTGELVSYRRMGNEATAEKWRVTKLGAPMVREK